MFTDSWLVKFGVIGALLAFISSSVQTQLDRKHEKECLSIALKSEISSILERTAKGDILNIAAHYLSRMNLGENLPMPRVQDKEVRSSEILQTMYPIFHAHIKDIGILNKHIVGNLTTFYTNCVGLQSVLIKFARGEWDSLPLERKIKILQYNLEVWQKTKVIGEKLIIELEQ